MSVSQRQLAAAIRTAAHIADRDAIAAILLDEGTTFAAHNPFARTSAGAQRYIWTGNQRTFRGSNTSALGVSCLLEALYKLPTDEPLVQEILQAGLCRAYVYHHGDGCRIVGSVVHAKGNASLPAIRPLPRKRGRPPLRCPTSQLDLFVIDGAHASFG